MNFYRRITAPVAATALAVSLISAPLAGAAEHKPSDISGQLPQAEITQAPRHIENPGVAYDGNEALAWRKVVGEYSQKYGDRVAEWWAHSPSMDRHVPLVVIKADQAAGPRPTIYLLNGGDGGEGRANWIMQSDAIDFYISKNVNVVVPMQGKFSYYTDWVEDVDNLGGKQMWETFLTKELPGPLEAALGASNKRAVAGMSMSATTSLLYAEHNPGFYDAVGSFSGCAQTSGGLGLTSIDMTLQRGGLTKEQMWGPLGGDLWNYNDALTNAGDLRGTEVYVSNASGLVGASDLWGAGRTSADVALLTVEGGVIEAATNMCTHDLKTKLDAEGVPATFNFRPTGTHSWPYWQQDLRGSWDVFAKAFGIEA
ncbi:alpha/beta hydrolase family protein [Corynebacterium sp. P5875]|uniref:Alpha/beta hydrolase family protein n=1 Tax=Corynebacterium antarcticum TaxID=2800405 RepID=A0A9Q4CEI7_9CORY|nr:alpha/beta hydrolase family protein [Corynebacterium antarcticum]MCX7537994.1 alpha/beta hydrolase family protein [Corynebacterium antarcticum]